MKKYIKPVAECYNVQTAQLMEPSVGISNEAASATYDGGGDAKRGRNAFGTFDDDEEDY